MSKSTLPGVVRRTFTPNNHQTSRSDSHLNLTSLILVPFSCHLQRFVPQGLSVEPQVLLGVGALQAANTTVGYNRLGYGASLPVST